MNANQQSTILINGSVLTTITTFSKIWKTLGTNQMRMYKRRTKDFYAKCTHMVKKSVSYTVLTRSYYNSTPRRLIVKSFPNTVKH